MAEPSEQELVIIREFNVPREIVWKAWANPELLKKWWGPKDFTCPVSEIDFRVGGQYLHCMRGPAGTEFDKDYWSTGTYKEITPLEEIVVSDSFADERGDIVPATYYGMSPDFPLEMEIIVTFKELDGKTKMTLRHIGLPASDQEGAREGWNQSFDKLEKILK